VANHGIINALTLTRESLKKVGFGLDVGICGRHFGVVEPVFTRPGLILEDQTGEKAPCPWFRNQQRAMVLLNIAIYIFIIHYLYLLL
jgi:hypothetical protein